MMKKIVIGLAAIFALALVTSAQAGQIVVIKSDAPEIVPGTIFDDDKSISVEAGNSVTLITETGKIIAIAGPFEGKAETSSEASNSNGKNIIAALSTIAKGAGSSDQALGATRAGPLELQPPTPWHITVEQTGEQCFRGGAPEFWREESWMERFLTIKSDNATVEVSWPVNQETLLWPQDVKLVDGATYSIGFASEDTTNKVVLYRAPEERESSSPEDILDDIVWMATVGCVEQAKRLLTTLE